MITLRAAQMRLYDAIIAENDEQISDATHLLIIVARAEATEVLIKEARAVLRQFEWYEACGEGAAVLEEWRLHEHEWGFVATDAR